MKSIAILITTYNEEKYIYDCLQSIKSQTLLPNTVYLIDNASTDNTLDICKAFKFTNLNFVIRSNAYNIGALESFELGLNLVKEDFLMYLGAHDLIASTYLQECYSTIMTSSSIGHVYSKNIRIDEQSNYLRIMSGGNFVSENIGVRGVIDILNYGIHECTAVNGFYRTHVLKKCRKHKKYRPDILLLLNIASKYSIHRVNLPLYMRREFRQRSSSYFERISGQKETFLSLMATCQKKIDFIFQILLIYFLTPVDTIFFRIKKIPAFLIALEKSFGIFTLRFIRNFFASKI